MNPRSHSSTRPRPDGQAPAAAIPYPCREPPGTGHLDASCCTHDCTATCNRSPAGHLCHASGQREAATPGPTRNCPGQRHPRRKTGGRHGRFSGRRCSPPVATRRPRHQPERDAHRGARHAGTRTAELRAGPAGVDPRLRLPRHLRHPRHPGTAGRLPRHHAGRTGAGVQPGPRRARPDRSAARTVFGAVRQCRRWRAAGLQCTWRG